MQISETLGNEIKNKFEEDWQDYIDENSIPEEEQAGLSHHRGCSLQHTAASCLGG